jgi:hypothetical protein
VTFAGSVAIAFHGNVSFAATGITRSYTGGMVWAGNASYTFTTNGLTFANTTTINGVGATWTLGSALNIGTSTVTVTNGTFDTSSAGNYAVTAGQLSSNNPNTRAINLNASTINLSGDPVVISSTLTFNAGTSQINCSSISATFSATGQTFYNVSFTSTTLSFPSIGGANTFNNLSVTGRTSVGIGVLSINANQTINGTLTLSAGSAAAYRMFLASDTIGTTRTLTVNAFAAGAADIDFRDITVTGSAAPLTGTRLGDAKGNSGITFDAAKTVYYRATSSSDWGLGGASGAWSATSGGAFDVTMFPLAQDTAVFPAATYPASGSTTTINAAYNIGTIDMSLRTSNTMTLATGSTNPFIYGNWTNGTGTTLSGTGTLSFAGRGSQTITSSAKTFTQRFTITTPGGSVTLQDSFSSINAGVVLNITEGTFNAATYNVTFSSATSVVSTNATAVRTLGIGSGTWTLAGSGNVFQSTTATNLTVTGTGTISLTSASAKTFAGGNANYSGITLNQGGAGTLTISGNNTFADITNTAVGATTISLAATTQTVGAWTAKGTAGNLLTITGTSAASAATLIYTGAGAVSGLDYLVPTSIRAYPTTSTWYAGANSTNGGSLGWIFAAYVPPTPGSGNGNFLVFF